MATTAALTGRHYSTLLRLATAKSSSNKRTSNADVNEPGTSGGGAQTRVPVDSSCFRSLVAVGKARALSTAFHIARDVAVSRSLVIASMILLSAQVLCQPHLGAMLLQAGRLNTTQLTDACI